MAESTRFQRTLTAGDAQRVRNVDFPIVLRGYDRGMVDRYVEETARLVAELESTQLRESVVQRALDEVGEETSSILRRAHETAEEITSRSRAKAEGRLQRAERESDLLRREADEYAERIVADTRHLWDERQRLIEEMRQLADEVLGTADEAIDRLSEPEMLRRQALATEPEETTVMPAVDAVEPEPETAGELPALEEDAEPEVELPLVEADEPPVEQSTVEVDAVQPVDEIKTDPDDAEDGKRQPGSPAD